MRNMVDVLDYMRRLFAAVFLCPVAAAFWVLFTMSGFSLTNFFIMCGGFAQSLSSMSPGEFGVFMFQFLGGWASLAFLFLLMTFTFNPPKFQYTLNRHGEQHHVSVTR